MPEPDDLLDHAFDARPLTPEGWADLEQLFGARGACGGCWCMYWVLTRSQFDTQKGEGNRAAMRARVDAGEVPGLIGYVGGEPAGWCAVQPRERYPVLERSRVLARVDERPVWSLPCLFVTKAHRQQGLSLRLVRAAVEYAAGRGAMIVEGYPLEPKSSNMPDAFAWTGIASTFRKAGFVEALRRSESRPIMRYFVSPL